MLRKAFAAYYSIYPALCSISLAHGSDSAAEASCSKEARSSASAFFHMSLTILPCIAVTATPCRAMLSEGQGRQLRVISNYLHEATSHLFCTHRQSLPQLLPTCAIMSQGGSPLNGQESEFACACAFVLLIEAFTIHPRNLQLSPLATLTLVRLLHCLLEMLSFEQGEGVLRPVRSFLPRITPAAPWQQSSEIFSSPLGNLKPQVAHSSLPSPCGCSATAFSAHVCLPSSPCWSGIPGKKRFHDSTRSALTSWPAGSSPALSAESRLTLGALSLKSSVFVYSANFTRNLRHGQDMQFNSSISSEAANTFAQHFKARHSSFCAWDISSYSAFFDSGSLIIRTAASRSCALLEATPCSAQARTLSRGQQFFSQYLPRTHQRT